MGRKRFTGIHPGQKAATKAVVSARTTETVELLVQGYSPVEIAKKVHRKWGISPSTVNHYIRRATEALAKSDEVIRAAELTKAIRRFNYVYKDNKTLDSKTAFAAAGKICEVLKLGELGKIDVTLKGKVEHEHSVTPEQAETIFGILEGAGALDALLTPAETE